MPPERPIAPPLWMARLALSVAALFGAGCATRGAPAPPEAPPWIAGSPHPELSNVVRSERENLWTGGPGYRVVSASAGSDILQNRCTDPVAAEWNPGQEFSREEPWRVASADRVGAFVLAPGFVWNDQKSRSHGVWTEGLRHPVIANIQSAARQPRWKPDPGYRFVGPGNAYTRLPAAVEPKPGWTADPERPQHEDGRSTPRVWAQRAPVDGFPNVETGPEPDTWIPRPGYELVDDGPAAEWTPGLSDPERPRCRSSVAIGRWDPEPGYAWVDDVPGPVRWSPGLEHACGWDPSQSREGLLAGQLEGRWVPAPGYVRTGEAGGLPVVAWGVDEAVDGSPHVRGGDRPGQWRIESGYAEAEPGTIRRAC